MNKKLLLILSAFIAFALIAAGCGSDDEETADGDDDTTETTAGDDGTTETTAAMDDAMDGSDTNVGLVFDLAGRGDQSFNDAAAAGIDKAAADLGITFQEATPNEDGSNRAELLQAAADGSQLVVGVGFAFADTMGPVATDNPDTNFAIIDDGSLVFDNVLGLVFAEEQGSFLVGAAAALKSESGTIGFVGGVENDLIKKFEAGFVAGATQINPDIVIDTQYIAPDGDFSGFNDPASGKVIGASMYDGGADIVYAAAGSSGIGVFEAATDVRSAGGTAWAIGVDSDQYLTAPDFQDVILTSMIKRVDVAVDETIHSQVDGSFAGGVRVFDLSVDGVGYSTSGGYVDDIAAQLDELKAQIADGTITVPTTP